MSNPFVPGAEVVFRTIHSFGDPTYSPHIRVIDKVYKNGNFTLVPRKTSEGQVLTCDAGKPQQYKPSSHSGWGDDRRVYWTATQVGDRYGDRGSFLPYDDHTKAEIERVETRAKLEVRAREAKDKIARLEAR